MGDDMAPVVDEELGLGDHVAFFFKTNEERLAFVIPYMIKGLENLERCVYIAHENSVEDILAEFAYAGIDVDTARASGALSVLTKDETYVRNGIFEPQKMIAGFDREISSALRQGFSGLRVTGEMSWALNLPDAVIRLCEYEQELCQRWPTQLGGLCQYNESLFPSDLIETMAGCHCVVVRDGTIVRHHTHPSEELI